MNGIRKQNNLKTTSIIFYLKVMICEWINLSNSQGKYNVNGMWIQWK